MGVRHKQTNGYQVLCGNSQFNDNDHRSAYSDINKEFIDYVKVAVTVDRVGSVLESVIDFRVTRGRFLRAWVRLLLNIEMILENKEYMLSIQESKVIRCTVYCRDN